MTQQYLTRQQVRDIDRRAIDEYGLPGLVLMENAGRGCVDVLRSLGIGGDRHAALAHRSLQRRVVAFRLVRIGQREGAHRLVELVPVAEVAGDARDISLYFVHKTGP